MTEDNNTIEPVEFEEPVIQRIKLNGEEAKKNRIATITKDIPFVDYSQEPAVNLIFEASITPIAIDERRGIVRKCTQANRSGIPELDWDLFEDMVIAKTYGLTIDEWSEFKKTHPIGLYTKMELIANEINGRSALSEDDIEELKNLGGQGQ